MNVTAAENFWKWFAENEEWIKDNIKTNGMSVINAIDAKLTPVFPQFKKEIEFQLGFNNGIGEFFFFHFGNKNLIRDAKQLAEMMPATLKSSWKFVAEK